MTVDVKRVLDIAAASAGLVVCAPVMAAAAIAIRRDSPGDIFFRQERVGRNGRPFTIHKFRTMRQVHDGATVSASGDTRVTRVGRWLRKTKIDELPQLFDVVRGEMSLVGPRPELAKYVDGWPEDLRPLILSVRPGISDPVSIGLRNEAEILAEADDPEAHYVSVLLPAKAQGYADYVRTRSLIGDLRIIVRTVTAIGR